MSSTSLINGSLVTDANGRVRYSGVSSGIDFNAIIDATIQAKQVPIDRITANITDNKTKIDALNQLSSLMQGVKTSLSTLYGQISLGNANNIFSAKSAYATSSRSDGGTATSAASLLGVTTTNAAEASSHDVQVLQIAKAEKLGSATFNSTTSDLGTAVGGAAGSIAGSFDINGTTITVSSSDTLGDLRDRINNANTGTNATGVSASIVSAGTNQYVLVLTAAKTGQNITINNETGSVLSALGISDDGGATFTNELQAAQKAQLKADGLKDPSQYESALVASASDPLSTYGVTGTGNTFDLYDGSGALLGSVSYDSTDTLTTLAGKISAVSGVTAQVVTDGSQVKLQISGDGGASISVKNDSNNLVSGLSLAHSDLIIERDSNTINDLFTGITLSLYQAEVGTNINIAVEPDLSQVKTAVTGFVDAYNALKQFINQQNLTDPNTNEKAANAGPLFRDPVVANVETTMSSLLGNGATGVNAQFSVLAQIGVDFVDNNSLTDPTNNDTLSVDESKLDEALLNNADDVRRLFAFDFSSSDPRVQLLGFDGKAAYSASGYTLNIGSVGSSKERSGTVVDQTALLNDGTNSVGATTSGQFTLNGTAISYDVSVDGLDDIVGRINLAGIPGISATIGGTAGAYYIDISASGSDPVSISGDTGDLVSALNLTSQSTMAGTANVDGNADGSADGTATTSGRIVTVTDQSGAQGLRMIYTGDSNLSGVQVNFTVGLGTSMFYKLGDMLASNTGIVDAEINTLTEQDQRYQDRVDFMTNRLDYQRQTMLDRFTRMEQLLATLSSQSDSLTQIVDAMSAKKN
ncbi:Flagellin hook IN motif-containing protein [Tistlia consotensis]|uniref:Flagellar hook-associated protein 2 n=1 Tax=Tistlia consotensis USBA 355 TaxID=560819 RepID=A0A1Y6CK21_9PROT|nr:flagellar filament capping protein FliD [Tistlia consotensis]SMF67770.1 Flagellin hook IN motif-containing protein [Tistlia consotensis USBA 355]SNR99526.1 Flagellin hook IN motif-containing protein [Tistlia consotensis]